MPNTSTEKNSCALYAIRWVKPTIVCQDKIRDHQQVSLSLRIWYGLLQVVDPALLLTIVGIKCWFIMKPEDGASAICWFFFVAILTSFSHLGFQFFQGWQENLFTVIDNIWLLISIHILAMRACSPSVAHFLHPSVCCHMWYGVFLVQSCQDLWACHIADNVTHCAVLPNTL